MLAIAGGKGGTGKTTTALGLARAFDGPTLVADADVDMPNLHALAGVEREPTAAAVADGAEPQQVTGRVAVFPAPPVSTDDAAVPTVLDEVARTTDADVVVDCPGGAGPDAAAPLSAASTVVLVSTACAPALRDTAKTAAMARALGCQIQGVVLTRTDVPLRGVESLLDCPVLGTVPTVSEPVLANERVRDAYAAVAAQLSPKVERDDRAAQTKYQSG